MPKGRVEPGLIQHTRRAGRSTAATYGGSFLYHLDQDRVYVGFVAGLDYADPQLHALRGLPAVQESSRRSPLLEGGEILAAGARAIAAGGWQSMPQLAMPGAVLIGDTGRRRERAEDQGRASGHALRRAGRRGVRPSTVRAGFEARWRASAGGQELKAVRNIKPGFKRGLWFGLGERRLETRHGRHVALDAQAQGRLSTAAARWPNSTARTPLGGAHAAAARPRRLGVFCRRPRTMSPSRCT